MKTVLLITSLGAQYYQRCHDNWKRIDKPAAGDALWVIANIPEETLTALPLPVLFGPDRHQYLERQLAAAVPNSAFRAAAIMTGNRFKPGVALLTGLGQGDAVTREIELLDKQNFLITGVWGMSTLLALLARRAALDNILLSIPGKHFLRILVIKDGVPVLTRCIRRYTDETTNDSDTNEILRTRQHLINRRIFGYETMPAVLYLGDSKAIERHMKREEAALLPLPKSFAPKGDAAYLHPLFELVTTTPSGQLAPLKMRARHLALRLRQAAYAGIACSILVAIVFGQQNFRELFTLYGNEKKLQMELRQQSDEREHLLARIRASGTDPERVRQATQFSAREMENAPAPDALLRIAAGTIADLPQVRIKSLSFRNPQPGELFCQGHTVIDLPLTDRKITLPPVISFTGVNTERVPRYTELQFSILLTTSLQASVQMDIQKRISTALKARKDIQLMQDPAAFSLINTIKGGFGMDTTGADKLWCMSIPWKSATALDLL